MCGPRGPHTRCTQCGANSMTYCPTSCGGYLLHTYRSFCTRDPISHSLDIVARHYRAMSQTQTMSPGEHELVHSGHGCSDNAVNALDYCLWAWLDSEGWCKFNDVICVGDPASFIGGSNAWTRRRLSVTPFCVYGHRCSYKLRDAMHRTHLL